MKKKVLIVVALIVITIVATIIYKSNNHYYSKETIAEINIAINIFEDFIDGKIDANTAKGKIDVVCNRLEETGKTEDSLLSSKIGILASDFQKIDSSLFSESMKDIKDDLKKLKEYRRK